METHREDGAAAVYHEPNIDPETTRNPPAAADMFEMITAESLRRGKGYAKEMKKQEKEIDSMKDRHQRERILLNKAQCDAIEKLCVSVTENDPSYKSLVLYQDKEWTQMLERHKGEEWQLRGAQRLAKVGLLPQLMKKEQLKQLKQLEVIHEKELRELRAVQAINQAEYHKGLEMSKEASTFQERFRTRRLIDLKLNKIYEEERKKLVAKQDRDRERLATEHAKQMTELSLFVQNSI
jgi:phosphatidylinositol phospholipase C beta